MHKNNDIIKTNREQVIVDLNTGETGEEDYTRKNLKLAENVPIILS